MEFEGDEVARIERALETQIEKEELMRSVFQVVRHMCINIINEMLEDFRNKRAIGELCGLAQTLRNR